MSKYITKPHCRPCWSPGRSERAVTLQSWCPWLPGQPCPHGGRWWSLCHSSAESMMSRFPSESPRSRTLRSAGSRNPQVLQLSQQQSDSLTPPQSGWTAWSQLPRGWRPLGTWESLPLCCLPPGTGWVWWSRSSGMSCRCLVHWRPSRSLWPLVRRVHWPAQAGWTAQRTSWKQRVKSCWVLLRPLTPDFESAADENLSTAAVGREWCSASPPPPRPAGWWSHSALGETGDQEQKKNKVKNQLNSSLLKKSTLDSKLDWSGWKMWMLLMSSPSWLLLSSSLYFFCRANSASSWAMRPCDSCLPSSWFSWISIRHFAISFFPVWLQGKQVSHHTVNQETKVTGKEVPLNLSQLTGPQANITLQPSHPWTRFLLYQFDSNKIIRNPIGSSQENNVHLFELNKSKFFL